MGILDTLKTVGNTLREADKIDQYQQILEVQQLLLDMQEENQNLKKENQELRDKLIQKKKLKFESNSYWNEEDGPFCMNCYDDAGKMIRLIQWEGDSGKWMCNICKESYNITR